MLLHKKERVAYLGQEGSRKGLQRRLGWAAGAIPGPRAEVPEVAANGALLRFKALELAKNPEKRKLLLKILKDNGFTTLIVDTLAASAGAVEEWSPEWNDLWHWFEYLAHQEGITVVVLHHLNRAGQASDGPRKKGHGRGGSTQDAAADCCWSTRKLPPRGPGWLSLELTTLKVREGECEDEKTYTVHLDLAEGTMEWETPKDAGAKRVNRALMALLAAEKDGKHMLPKGRVLSIAGVNAKGAEAFLEALDHGKLVKVYGAPEEAEAAGWKGSSKAIVVHLTVKGFERARQAKEDSDK